MSILSDDVNQLDHDIIQVTTTIVVIDGAFFVLATLVVGMATLLMLFLVLVSVTLEKFENAVISSEAR